MRIYVDKDNRRIMVEVRVPSGGIVQEELTLTEAIALRQSLDSAITELANEVSVG